MPRHMTREGYDRIRSEISHLWSVERPHVVEQVTHAAELGDRSENAEYIYGKKRLREIDGRLEYLRKRIDGVTVVDLDDIQPSPVIKFGALVEVEDGEGERTTYRLVDKDESDPKRCWISVQSPVGKALLGRREGDAVEIFLPAGQVELEIVAVRYGKDG